MSPRLCLIQPSPLAVHTHDDPISQATPFIFVQLRKSNNYTSVRYTDIVCLAGAMPVDHEGGVSDLSTLEDMLPLACPVARNTCIGV